MKLATLRPSLRIDRRYLLIEAKNKEEVEKVILDYIGILGYAKAAPLFVKDENEAFRGKIILAIERKSVENVRAAFEICKENIKVLRVSGTIKGLSKK